MACLKILYLAWLFPGSKWAIIRRKHVDLVRTTMQTFFKFCPPEAYEFGGRRADTEKELRLNNGSVIIWMHLDDPDIMNVLQGIEANGALIDQSEEIEEEIFDKLETRIGRWDMATVPDWLIKQEGGWDFRNPETGQPIPPPFVILTCNPDTELHWLYQRFHPDSPNFRAERELQDGSTTSYCKEGYRMIIMDSEKNIFLPKMTLQKMLSKDASFVRRYVRGQWGIPEGQIHDISKASEIEGTHERAEWVRRTCRLYRVLDHGDTAPTCCLWLAVDSAGNHIFYREYYQPDRLISDHRGNISRLSSGERYTDSVADPSIFVKTMQKHGGRWAVADEYADRRFMDATTAIDWNPGDNDELSTRDRINELLRIDPQHINPFTGMRGAPRIYFFTKTRDYPNGCAHAQRQITAQRRVKIGTSLGRPIFADERVESIEDHGYDCVRYAVAIRAAGSKDVAAQRSPDSFAAKRRKLIKFTRKGGFRVLSQRAAREALDAPFRRPHG